MALGGRARQQKETRSVASAFHVRSGAESRRRAVNCCSISPSKRRNGGSAVLIVLILLSVMAVLVASNTVVLRRLKVELQLLDQKQTRAVQERTNAK